MTHPFPTRRSSDLSGRTGKGRHGGAAFYASRVTKARPSGYGTGKLVRSGNLNGPGKQKACSRRFLFLHRRKVRPPALLPHAGEGAQIGRASCRESVCQYVSISVVDGSLKKTK